MNTRLKRMMAAYYRMKRDRGKKNKDFRTVGSCPMPKQSVNKGE